MKKIFEISFIFIGLILHFLFRIFNINILHFLGFFISRIFWNFSKDKRGLIKEELKLLFGERFDEIHLENIAKKSFENHYKKQVETLFFGCLTKQTMERLVHVEGIENLDVALSKGKGVILLLSHFGSFLLPLPFLAYRGYKINQIAGKEINPSLLQEQFWTWRKREANKLPVRFIQVGYYLRPVYERLKNNEIVAIAFDGRDSGKWISVKLFNRSALFSPGPFNLALKAGAAIIPTFIVRKGKEHKLILEPSFDLRHTGNHKEDLSLNIKRYSRIFSDYLLKYPCHMGFVFMKARKHSDKNLSVPLFEEDRS